MPAKSVLKSKSSAELLSYIINQTPILSEEIDLPKQGESIAEIGKIIVNNDRYRNAFINTVNLIGLTVIKRNAYTNPWDFTDKGTLDVGQQIREIINDLVDVYDYNEQFDNKTQFLQTQVPNVFNYIHELNFQKYYHVTIARGRLLQAFLRDDLESYIDDAISMMWTSFQYDKYIVNKYMLCRRMCNGTMTSIKIENYDTIDERDKVSAIQNISSLMTFMKPNYNPAGIHRATPYDKQILIVNTNFRADYSTKVLATAFFKSEAELTARLKEIDGFDDHDTIRLQKLLKNQYTAFTEAELGFLKNVPAVLIADDFFMNYAYALDNTPEGTVLRQFENPTSLEDHHYLHVWYVFSTSPFANNAIFTKDDVTVKSVKISPATVTSSTNQEVQFNATVETTGFANKAVTWESNNEHVVIDINGNAKILEGATGSITITARSIYDNTKTGTATLSIPAEE